MTTPLVPYPATPKNVNGHILVPSLGFRNEVLKALAAILFFIVTYLLLVAGALGLAALCALGGVGLVILKPMFLTLMVGIGLAGLGVMVVFFMFKFIFKRHTVDRSAFVEVTEHDQPRLFEFIRRLAGETRTTFPKKIYLSQAVNASVFYDSGFWSMFLPVRKNLMIGLGLVNTITTSEFKAIVAHEFGHFSQRSMKLGSYVYNMNQVIYNLLYENEGYGNLIRRWGSASGYFAIFAVLTVHVVNGIQWILGQVYGVVNKQYMSLSRQMEFHADTVAAAVSGGNHLISSLRRIEVAEITYQNTLGFYEENIKNGLKPINLYPQHREAMKEFAFLHHLPVENGLPQVNARSLAGFNKSRITIKDQWASHPSTDDRETHLRSLNLETPSENQSAWSIFDAPEQLQELFTERIFEKVNYDAPVQSVNEVRFSELYKESLQRYQFPDAYRGFFNSRHISAIDLRNLETRIAVDRQPFQELLSEEVLDLPYRENGIVSDLQLVEAIDNGNLNVRNFEFDGQKYQPKNAAALRTQLGRELEEVRRALVDADERIIAWFLAHAGNAREKLREKYSGLFILTTETDTNMKAYTAMQARLMPRCIKP
jgi:Zn-dependent protease with chaperone function